MSSASPAPTYRGSIAKGVELILELGTIAAPSPIGTAQATRDARAQVRFGRRTGDVHSAVEQAVDERPNDFRAIQRLAAFSADVDGEAIEVDDLAVEKHNQSFGP